MAELNVMVPNGAQVKAKISGFTGTVVARMDCLFGGGKVLVEAGQLNSNGEPVSLWLDEASVVQIDQMPEPAQEEPGPRV